MKKTLVSVGCAFLLLGAGCLGRLLGDPYARCTVSLKLASSGLRTNTHYSVNDAQVQAALGVIDNVMVSQGLSRKALHPPDPNLAGNITEYVGSPNSTCKLFLRDDRLFIVFSEFQGHRLSAGVDGLCDSLADRLKVTYGSKPVTLTHNQ